MDLKAGELDFDYETQSDFGGITSEPTQTSVVAGSSYAKPADQALNTLFCDIHRNEETDEPSNVDLIDTLTSQALEQKGSCLNESVAGLLRNHLSRDVRRSVPNTADDQVSGVAVASKLKEYKVLGNVTDLTSCEVNGAVYKALSPVSKKYANEGK